MIISSPVNRLAREKSPYLLQHQHNPVDWHSWGDEAFERARRESKPIFLSIGYSTCHWCHVMERESFENEEVAEYLNAYFVSIKVDREERPDVDKIYMTAVQAMTGQGGWPLNCFLTPDLKPFFGGTYFPPESRQGRLGILQILEQVRRFWEARRGEVVVSAQSLYEKLLEYTAQATSGDVLLQPGILSNAAALFKQEYDSDNGGFGSAPKFPRPSQPLFLLHYGVHFEDDDAIRMVLHTCDRMADGGIRDQIGGGFHRYSVDAQWLVPHFEKMLYDNAQLSNLFLDAYLVSGNERYEEVVRQTLDYVLRDMTHPEGGFHSAEDADSEGKEGKFYCWTRAELGDLLTREEFDVAVRYYGITEDGNFTDHSDPDPLPNQNVLSIVDPLISPREQPLIESAKGKMLKARESRVRPQCDDKVLASWNGMMLGALARAYAVLGDETYRAAAERNLAFLQADLWDGGSKTLHHRWREGERDHVQLLEDYANLMGGVIDLYEATLIPQHLDFAIALAQSMLARFYDPANGGFYQSSADSKDLILRSKEDYDGAEPSGASVATLGLLKLGAITGRKEFANAAEKTLCLLAERMHGVPQAVPHLLLGLDFFLEAPVRAVVVSDGNEEKNGNYAAMRALVQVIHSATQTKVVLGNQGEVEPFAKTLPVTDRPRVFLCTGTACQPPTGDAKTLRACLETRQH